ncbi:MAG: 50S ribosomal protein L29 [Candidatus Omnitrophica bacterium]|nr:50S ribosomal protein L29 [Candidatus Omnitrophota bacterium]
MKVKELSELSKEDLEQKEKNLKKQLFELNFQRKMGTVEKPSQFRQCKRDIARIQTIIRERELADERGNKNKK